MGLGSSALQVKKYKLSKLELYKKKQEIQVFQTKSKKMQSFCKKWNLNITFLPCRANVSATFSKIVLVGDLISMHVFWLLCMLPKILSLDVLLFNTSIHPEAGFHTCNAGEQFKIRWNFLEMWNNSRGWNVDTILGLVVKEFIARQADRATEHTNIVTMIHSDHNSPPPILSSNLIFKNLQSYQFCVNTC